MKSFLAFLICFSCLTNLSLSQKPLILLDHISKNPIEGVFVFVDKTSYSVLSDTKGEIFLDNNIGENEMITFTHLNYQVFSSPFSSIKALDTLKLIPKVHELASISIKAKSSKKRKKWLKQFELSFLGINKDKNKTSILNKEDILFIENESGLHAVADVPLKILNEGLGYKITYWLGDFVFKQNREVSYHGKFYIEDLAKNDAKLHEKLFKKRQKAFENSLKHYLTTLESKNHKRYYDSYIVKPIGGGAVKVIGKFNPKAKLEFDETSDLYTLTFRGMIQIDHLEVSARSSGNQMGNVSGLGRKAEQEMILQENSSEIVSKKFESSWLYASSGQIVFDKNGKINNTKEIKEYGYLAGLGLADVMPSADFLKEEIKIEYPQLNGFTLSDLKIPYEHIKSGGVPRNGIPALDFPKFYTADEATYLSPEDLVLGTFYGNIPKAYPLKILDRHELVNDITEKQTALISHCPLCNSTIVFDRNIDGQILKFRVSGLLYQSDVLMYDEESESLWSQLEFKSISGAYSGKELKILPSEIIRWKDWTKKYPESLVLSDETGIYQSYNSEVYREYKSSDRLMFPVLHKSEKLTNKEVVLGITYKGIKKAYPIKRFNAHNRVIKDILGGKVVTIEVNESLTDAKFIDMQGQEIPHVRSYWFAWYTFNPKTLLYRR